ncbi:MAG: peptidylprolyl isomerase [Saprospiraceae bacterium]|nr:peptidylprolyl isomerase [Saprospiraceae bacterium]MBK8853640.1 peptidylprolyl isomerase [Saprospiraceae bacterium]MBK9041782.1 peptidylprolyl isomerase [Saprospiraceae bacterium]
MALIGKIRKNMWLVIVLLAVALAGFIIMDMTSANNRGNGIFGTRNAIGKVDGKKIDYNEFQKAESALYSGSSDVYGRRNSLWNYFLEKAIVDEYKDLLGIGVSSDELNELEFGNNLSPIVQNNFRSPQTGQVDREQLNQFQEAINNGQELAPQFVNFWNEQRKQVIKTSIQSKLTNMVSKAMVVPTWMAELSAKSQSEKVDFDYVMVPFTKVDDAEVKLTDEDYDAFIKKNATKYTNKEEVRNLSYVVFDVLPSQADSQKIYNDLLALKQEFIQSKKDSLFVSSNSGMYNPSFQKKDELQGVLKDTISKFNVGDVIGPYIEGNSYMMAKISERKVMADSAKARHILRNVQAGDALGLVKAKSYIDSLKNLIASGANFNDLATTNSQDPGSAQNGGDLGTFAPGAMVGPFNDAIFITGKEGGMYTVETQFGVHLIKVEKLKFISNEGRYKIAYLRSPIVPSQETQDKKMEEVLAASEKLKTIDALNADTNIKVESANGLKKNDFNIGNLGSSQSTRDIIRWAFDKKSKPGNVSGVIYTYTDEENYHDSKHVMVGLKSITKAGLASAESLKGVIDDLVKNEKKAEIIKSKITSKDLNTIAATFGLVPAKAEGVTFASGLIPDLGTEPKVIGKAFASKSGVVSEPIVGKTGVCIINVTNITPGTAGENVAMIKQQMAMSNRSQVSYKLMEAIKKSKKVTDNRFTFY